MDVTKTKTISGGGIFNIINFILKIKIISSIKQNIRYTILETLKD